MRNGYEEVGLGVHATALGCIPVQPAVPRSRPRRGALDLRVVGPWTASSSAPVWVMAYPLASMPQLVDIAFYTSGDPRSTADPARPDTADMPNYSEQYRIYASGLVRGGDGVASSTPIAGSLASRARTAIDAHFRDHSGHRLRHIYFVGHGSLGDYALSGHMLVNEFVALSPRARLDAGDEAFWRTVRGKMVLADNEMGEVAHQVDFRACNLGAGTLPQQVARYLGQADLRGSVYSARSHFDFQPERRGRRRTQVRARVEGGSWTYPPARPRGPTARIVPFG